MFSTFFFRCNARTYLLVKIKRKKLLSTYRRTNSAARISVLFSSGRNVVGEGGNGATSLGEGQLEGADHPGAARNSRILCAAALRQLRLKVICWWQLLGCINLQGLLWGFVSPSQCWGALACTSAAEGEIRVGPPWLHGRRWTAARKQKHGLQDDDRCALCDESSESSDHLLVGCVFSREVWAWILLLLGLGVLVA
jgi:hypothetical protein